MSASQPPKKEILVYNFFPEFFSAHLWDREVAPSAWSGSPEETNSRLSPQFLRDNIKLPTSELPSSWQSWFRHWSFLLKLFVGGYSLKTSTTCGHHRQLFFLTPIMKRYINGDLCLEIFQSRIPIRYLSEEAACLLLCYYVGRSSSAHNKITINEAMLVHQ